RTAMNGCDLLRLYLGVVENRLAYIIRHTDQVRGQATRIPEVLIALVPGLGRKKLWVGEMLQVIHHGYQGYGRMKKEWSGERTKHDIGPDVLPGQSPCRQRRLWRRLLRVLGHAKALDVSGLQGRQFSVVGVRS